MRTPSWQQHEHQLARFKTFRDQARMFDNESLYVFAKFHNKVPSIVFLIDTGAEVSTLSRDMYECIPEKERVPLRPVSRALTSASCEELPVYGAVTLQVTFGAITVVHEFWVCDMTEYAILGVDFLKQHGATLDVSRRQLTVYGRRITLCTSTGKGLRRHVFVVKGVRVLPSQYGRVLCCIEGYEKAEFQRGAYFEPAAELYHTAGVVAGRTWIRATDARLAIRVYNPGPKVVYLYPDMRLGDTRGSTADDVEGRQQSGTGRDVCQRCSHPPANGRGEAVSPLTPSVDWEDDVPRPVSEPTDTDRGVTAETNEALGRDRVEDGDALSGSLNIFNVAAITVRGEEELVAGDEEADRFMEWRNVAPAAAVDGDPGPGPVWLTPQVRSGDDAWLTMHGLSQLQLHPGGDCLERKVTQPVSGPLPTHMYDLYQKSISQVEEGSHAQVAALLADYADVFASNPTDLGRTTWVKHHIDTGNHPPVRERGRRHSMAARVEMERQVLELRDKGIVKPSTGEWASNVVMVGKKDGTMRMCVDYRSVNEITVNSDPYMLPRIDEMLDRLAGSKWFTTLDLIMGFHQVELTESSKVKTAFIVPGMVPPYWQFEFMPFGLNGAPRTFQRLIDMVMEKLPYNIAMAYLDDVIIYSSTVTEKVERLRRVFKRMREAGLKLKATKCELFQKQTGFLGHVVSQEGIHVEPKKVLAVKAWTACRTRRQIKSFLGLVGYYRRFIPEFAEIARPLYELDSVTVRFKWGEECSDAMRTLQALLEAAPVLAYPECKGLFILETRIRERSLCATLKQEQTDERGVHRERLLQFGSKRMQPRELNYCIRRRELLATVHFVKYYRPYLWGREVLLRTAHASIQHIRRLSEPTEQMNRWLGVLENTLKKYTIEIPTPQQVTTEMPPPTCGGKVCICLGVYTTDQQLMDAEVTPLTTEKGMPTNSQEVVTPELEGDEALSDASDEEFQEPRDIRFRPTDRSDHATEVVRGATTDGNQSWQLQAIKQVPASGPSVKGGLSPVEERGGNSKVRSLVIFSTPGLADERAPPPLSFNPRGPLPAQAENFDPGWTRPSQAEKGTCTVAVLPSCLTTSMIDRQPQAEGRPVDKWRGVSSDTTPAEATYTCTSRKLEGISPSLRPYNISKALLTMWEEADEAEHGKYNQLERYQETQTAKQHDIDGQGYPSSTKSTGDGRTACVTPNEQEGNAAASARPGTTETMVVGREYHRDKETLGDQTTEKGVDAHPDVSDRRPKRESQSSSSKPPDNIEDSEEGELKWTKEHVATWDKFLALTVKPSRGQGEGTTIPEGTEEDSFTRHSVNAVQIKKVWTPAMLREAQLSDPDIAPILEAKEAGENRPTTEVMRGYTQAAKTYCYEWKQMEVHHGVLHRKWQSLDGKVVRFQIVLPFELRDLVLEQLHDAPTAGHLGQKKTRYRVQLRYYWFQMRETIDRWIKTCDACQKRKRPRKTPQSGMKMQPCGGIFQRVAMDICGKVRVTPDGNEYVLVVADYFSKYTMLFPLKDKESQTVLHVFATYWIPLWGCPEILHTDRGGEFTSKMMTEFCERFNIRKTQTTAHNPRSDGMVERLNHTIMQIVNTITSHFDEWDVALPFAQMAYNSTVHATTGETPNMVVQCRHIRMPIDVMTGFDEEFDDHAQDAYVKQVESDMRDVNLRVRDHTTRAMLAQKYYHDRKIHQFDYQEDDLVFVKRMRYLPLTRKITNRYEGPYVILHRLSGNCYRIARKGETVQTVTHDKLKPAYVRTEEDADLDWVEPIRNRYKRVWREHRAPPLPAAPDEDPELMVRINAKDTGPPGTVIPDDEEVRELTDNFEVLTCTQGFSPVGVSPVNETTDRIVEVPIPHRSTGFDLGGDTTEESSGGREYQLKEGASSSPLLVSRPAITEGEPPYQVRTGYKTRVPRRVKTAEPGRGRGRPKGSKNKKKRDITSFAKGNEVSTDIESLKRVKVQFVTPDTPSEKQPAVSKFFTKSTANRTRSSGPRQLKRSLSNPRATDKTTDGVQGAFTSVPSRTDWRLMELPDITEESDVESDAEEPRAHHPYTLRPRSQRN